MSEGISRRLFLGGGAAAAVGLGAAACAEDESSSTAAAAETSPTAMTVDFDGPHQAGVSTPEQFQCHLLGFNLLDGVGREEIVRLMRVWTDDSRRMTQGTPGLADLEGELLQAPANLTITVGFGPGLLEAAGLRDRAPEWLAPLPAYPTDQLDDRWGQTDLVVQVCGDDALTVSHAARYLVKGGSRYTTVAWIQDGFLGGAGTSAVNTVPGEVDGQSRRATPRNKFGQLDGTINPRTSEDFSRLVWIEQDDVSPDWMVGGTAMVVRRIAMHLDTWDIVDRPTREVVVGRRLADGAPLTGGDEFTDPDMEARDETGLLVIDPNSHMARARPPSDKPDQQLLRRVYTYDRFGEAGAEPTNDVGLMFICFQKNPLEQFHPIQQRLSEADRLNEWITHIGSAVYAVPPGTSEDEYWGQALLG